ncbi:right-handed parallel beta-helix repeat-containing protein [Halobacteria archaeon AArc-m2/3/4]|uniref:Right-handed parallel beta-helix repeat-containing protein n=1 Tax=Natronoglomus mannanivorans TaxID=2979990 RepID=A0ABT2QGW2_9EURY|nr:right-handed parallel beta-helix repeat-containing protein [Halobacteria archaeon AArc-m2/3/4]
MVPQNELPCDATDSHRDTTTDSARADRSGGGATTVSRRATLKAAAATGLSALGLSATAGANPEVAYYDEYRTVVNVAEAGADNTGTEPITPVLESVRSDNTLLYFPPGEYAMDSQFRFTNFEKFAVVGDDATLVPANYHDFDGPQYRLFRLGTHTSPGSHLRFEGFTVDQTTPDTGIRTIEAYATDRLEVRNIHVRGEHDSGTWGPGLFNVVDPDGTGIVEDFWAPDGGAWVDETPHAGNAWRGPIGIEANETRGTLQFKRCRLGAFPSNGLYASNGDGQIIVNGGHFENSNPVSIRVGGTNSRVLWPTVEIDRTRSLDESQRGIQLEHGTARVEGAVVRNTSPLPNSHAIAVMNTNTGARIDDTTVEIGGDRVTHGLVVSPDAGETTITETDVTHETAGGYPLWIRDTDSRERVTCRDVTISGESGDGAGFRDGIRCGRSNCRFESCDVEQRGRDGTRRNALVNTGDECTVYGGTYRATGHPFVELGDGTLYAQTDAESYTTDRAAIHLYAGSRNTILVRNRLANGIRNDGAEGLVTVANTY